MSPAAVTTGELERAARGWRREREAARVRRAELAAAVLEAHRGGMSISAIARATALQRVEVRRMLAGGGPDDG